MGKAAIVESLEHEFPRILLLEAVGLSASSFYYHRSKPGRVDHYSQARSLITGKYSDGFFRVYGYRRIRNDLVNKYGIRISHKTVLKLMHEEGRLSLIRKKKPYSSHRGEQGHTAENVVARNFEASKPQRKWVTDVTEFYVLGQKQYLSPVVDLFNREVISYALASTPTMGLVTAMLERAFTRLEPGSGLVMHSDQGWHYRHRSYQHALASRGIIQSMSRKGNCHDNAVAENFFSHFKEEFLRRNTFSSMAEFTMKLDRWIYWFNYERTQEKLKGLSPVDYRTQSLTDLETTPY